MDKTTEFHTVYQENDICSQVKLDIIFPTPPPKTCK